MCVIEMIQSKGFNGALREMAAVLNGASVPQSTPSRAPFKCRSGRYVSDPFSIIHHSLYLHYSSASSCRSSSCRSSPTFYLLLLLLLVLFVDWVLTPQTSAVEIGGRFSPPPPSLLPALRPSPPSSARFARGRRGFGPDPSAPDWRVTSPQFLGIARWPALGNDGHAFKIDLIESSMEGRNGLAGASQSAEHTLECGPSFSLQSSFFIFLIFLVFSVLD